jgi:DNA invertase Pin-like site-specific DNA recombinase
MAIFGYARVSRRDQAVENQRQEIERAGYMVDYWYADEGISGSSAAAQRPQFKLLLDRIRPGETLVVSKLDRLGRDAQDVGSTLKELAKREIAVIVLQLGKVDLTSPAGKLLVQMLAAVAEMEKDLLVEHTYAGLERAKSQGKTLGRPTKVTPKDRMEIIDQHQRGMSISALARRYQVSRATISRVVEAADANAAQAGQTTPESPAPQATAIPPAKASKRARKPAGKPVAARKADAPDMKLRATLDRKGQRRLLAV